MERPSVAVIDDDNDVLLLLEAALGDYRVDKFQEVEGFLKKFNNDRHAYDLIITDIHFPVKKNSVILKGNTVETLKMGDDEIQRAGIALFHHVREICPHQPMIVITGTADDPYAMAHVGNAEYAAFVPKGADLADRIINEVGTLRPPRRAVSIIGAGGNLGSMVARDVYRHLPLYVHELILVDRDLDAVRDVCDYVGASGSIDAQLSCVSPLTPKIMSLSEAISQSDIVFNAIQESPKLPITSAGVIDRNEVIRRDTPLIVSLAQSLQKGSFEGIVVSATGPLESMCYLLETFSEIPPNRLVGLGTTDMMRALALLQRRLVSENIITAPFTIPRVSLFGVHGDHAILDLERTIIEKDCRTSSLGEFLEYPDKFIVDVQTTLTNSPLSEFRRRGSVSLAPAAAAETLIRAICLDGEVSVTVREQGNKYQLRDVEFYKGHVRTINPPTVTHSSQKSILHQAELYLKRGDDAIKEVLHGDNLKIYNSRYSSDFP